MVWRGCSFACGNGVLCGWLCVGVWLSCGVSREEASVIEEHGGRILAVCCGWVCAGVCMD